ncbi:MAG: AraC family transcriptional regulator [Candidatus Eremiobacteraeota bacterium]|nr:AraC family transcriptional regulator [Candidatus Eremiobacteraeota bacterium]
MLPVEKALWYVESHFSQEIRLADLAELCEVSPSYLSRAFPMALGFSLKAYLRRRRLSEAARRLAEGAPDILALALEHGYGSHEAFTRAFREEFGLTPESVRAQGHVSNLSLLEAIRMNTDQIKDIQPLRLETSRALTVAGLSEHYEGDTAGIPSQWQRLAPYLGQVEQQVGSVAYGVCHNFEEGGVFDYLCGVEVKSTNGLPEGWSSIELPAGQTYAVFRHDEHISLIRHTCNSIYTRWLPQSGYKSSDAPFFERYGPEFDGRSGQGGLEVWVPVEK